MKISLLPLLALKTSTVSLFGLALIVGVIVYLFVRRGRIERELAEFYARHKLTLPPTMPAKIVQALGTSSTRWSCYEGVVHTTAGAQVPVRWWRGVRSEMMQTGTSAQTTLHFHLAVSFAPETVDVAALQKKADEEMKNATVTQGRGRRFFCLDTRTPVRTGTLADGTFLITWNSLDRAHIYEERMRWLQQHVTPTPRPAVVPTPSPAPVPEPAKPAMETPKPNEPERRPYREIIETAPEEHRAEVKILMNVLDSYNRDYHDTKAHPNMTLKDHCDEFKLTDEQRERVAQALSYTAYSADDLGPLGFDFAKTMRYQSDAMDVVFPHRRKMIFLIPQDTYLDLDCPGRMYVYEV